MSKARITGNDPFPPRAAPSEKAHFRPRKDEALAGGTGGPMRAGGREGVEGGTKGRRGRHLWARAPPRNGLTLRDERQDGAGPGGNLHVAARKGSSDSAISGRGGRSLLAYADKPGASWETSLYIPRRRTPLLSLGRPAEGGTAG